MIRFSPQLDDQAAVLRALGEATRIRIVAMLSHGELCVCHLVEALGLPQSTVSRHLGILRDAGLVVTRKAGRWVHYRLAAPPGGSRQLVGEIVAQLGADADLASKVSRLQRSCGPDA